ncbi:MAG: MFS transporter [Gaiellaceae bacterium]|nr:MFS transporter [Acidobacteriota bacterium]
MDALRRQLGVVGRSPGFRLLFLATIGSTLGTLLATIALVVDVKDRTDSGAWVSVLFIAQFLPAVAVGLLCGPLLDRLSRRGTMIAADLVRALVFVALAFVDSAGAIVALATVAGVATGFFRPAAYAGLPNLVEPDDLPAANAVLQTGDNIAWAAGPVIGGVLVAALGPHPAYWINAASFVLSAALLVRIPANKLQAVVAATHGHLRDLRDGIAFVARSAPLRTVLLAWTLAMLAIAAINATEVFLAKDSLNGGDFGYGLMYGATGVGLAIGSLAGGRWVEVRPIAVVYGGGIALLALAFGLAAVAPNVWVAAACCLLGGIGDGAAVLCNSLLVQRGAPDELRGRAFTVIMAVNYAAFGIGFLLGGVFNDAYGARWVWGGSALVLAAAGVFAYVLARGVPQRAAEPELEPAL